MKSKTTITIETVRQIRISGRPAGNVDACPLCGSEMDAHRATAADAPCDTGRIEEDLQLARSTDSE